MPNPKPLIARLMEEEEWIRKLLYAWHDMMEQCGYQVPSGKELKEKVEGRLKRT